MVLFEPGEKGAEEKCAKGLNEASSNSSSWCCYGLLITCWVLGLHEHDSTGLTCGAAFQSNMTVVSEVLEMFVFFVWEIVTF